MASTSSTKTNTTLYDDGSKWKEEFFDVKTNDVFLMIEYYKGGDKKCRDLYYDKDSGRAKFVRHRLDGPALVEYYQNGVTKSEEWFIKGKCHRLDDPATIEYDDTGRILIERWYVNDKAHRINGPAFIIYHPNGTIVFEAWYNNNIPHRVGGPATIWYNAYGSISKEEWYNDGIEVIV